MQFFGALFLHVNDILPEFFLQEWKIDALDDLQLEADRDPSRIGVSRGRARKAIFTCLYLST